MHQHMHWPTRRCRRDRCVNANSMCDSLSRLGWWQRSLALTASVSAAVGERERWREREKERDKGRGEKKSAEHASVCAHPAEHALAHSRACIGTRIRCIGTRISRGWTRVYSTENAHTRQVNAANACMCIAHGRHHSSTPCRCGRSSALLGWILGDQRGQARQK